MSRVQKGGAVFKPITQARPRPTPGAASRQASLVFDTTTEIVGASGLTQSSSQTLVSASPDEPVSTANPSQTQPPATASTLRGSAPIPSSSSTVIATPRSHKPLSSGPVALQKPPIVKGNLIATPSRSSGNPIAVGIPRPPSHRAPPLVSETVVPSISPPTPTAQPAPAASLEPIPPSTAPSGDPEAGPSTSAEDGATQASAKRSTRKRKRSTPTVDDDDASSTSSKTKPGRGRKSRAPSLPPYDANADPGEDLDPTVVTMASLCDDTGQGRVSSKAAEVQTNHAIWKKQNREKRSRMRAIMEARKYGRTEQEAELMQDGGAAPTPSSITPSTSNGSNVEKGDDSNPDFDYSQDLATSRYNVQVRIGPNGETIIDEESLVVNREETDETETYTHVTESDTSKFVNSATHSKRFRGSRWSAEETELFYDALMQHGENYELIAYMLPGRDRKSCKNKFKVEDKRNPARINHCLNNGTAPDIAYLSLMTGKDFSGPTPEIRAPSRPTIPPPVAEEQAERTHSEPAPAPKARRTKRSGTEEGLMIVGDASTMVPDFDS